MSVPYATASAGGSARDEITKMLRRFGCESVGFMDDFDNHEVLLAFTHKGRQIQLRASAKGWAQMFLKEQPYTHRRRMTRHDYEHEALQQGHKAVNSILRDWVKGQVTAIECGVMSFEAAFMPHILLPNGMRLIDHVQAENLLPAPPAEKVVKISDAR